jgi:hypothetical protein
MPCPLGVPYLPDTFQIATILDHRRSSRALHPLETEALMSIDDPAGTTIRQAQEGTNNEA